MTVTTMEIYEALISAGVDEKKARAAAEVIITRAEAKEVLVTKSDLYKALLIQTGANVAIISALLAIFLR